MKKTILAFATVLMVLTFTSCSNSSEQKLSQSTSQTPHVDTAIVYSKGFRGTNHSHGVPIPIKSTITECIYENTVKGYTLAVKDSVFGYKKSRMIIIDGPYEPGYEDQTKKIFFSSNNSGQIDSVQIYHYSWVIPTHFTPASQPHRSRTSVEVVKKSKKLQKLQTECNELMMTKDIVDDYVRGRMGGEYTYKDYEQAANVRSYDHNSDNTYVEEEVDGWHVSINDYLWIVRYKVNSSSNSAAVNILNPE